MASRLHSILASFAFPATPPGPPLLRLGDRRRYFLLAYSLGRVLVQGGTSLATQVAIANWFSLLRGRAIGVAAAGIRAGQAVLPAMVAFISSGPGWRYAWLFLGSIVLVFAILPSILLVRRHPEDVGAGLNLHLFPYLTDAGLTLPETVLATSLFFTVSAFGSILWGFVLERFSLRLCLAVALLVSAGGILLLLFASGLGLALLFAVVYGLSFGGNHIVLSTIWPAYYGRANVGAIVGAAMPVQMPGALLALLAKPPKEKSPAEAGL